MIPPEKMPTSALVRLIAAGASSAERREALEAEFDLRIPMPKLRVHHAVQFLADWLGDESRKMWHLAILLRLTGAEIRSERVVTAGAKQVAHVIAVVPDAKIDLFDQYLNQRPSVFTFIRMTPEETR